MYGLKDRNEATEMRARYSAMVNVLSDILDCGIWDIEELFYSKNNIEVGEIIKYYVEETHSLPSRNQIYYQAMENFASEYDLRLGIDVDIYANSCLDTHIYAREGLDGNIIEEMENIFNIEPEILKL